MEIIKMNFKMAIFRGNKEEQLEMFSEFDEQKFGNK